MLENGQQVTGPSSQQMSSWPQPAPVEAKKFTDDQGNKISVMSDGTVLKNDVPQPKSSQSANMKDENGNLVTINPDGSVLLNG